MDVRIHRPLSVRHCCSFIVLVLPFAKAVIESVAPRDPDKDREITICGISVCRTDPFAKAPVVAEDSAVYHNHGVAGRYITTL